MKDEKVRIIFAGGGTGGHIYPALATIEALNRKGDFEILYIGGYQGLENMIIPNEHIPYRKIWISGFQRFLTLKNILFPLKLLVSLLHSWWILWEYKPKAVIGTGGYVSGPVLYLAAKMGIPTIIQEQDSYPGITTRLLAKYVDLVCLPYPGVENHLKKIKGEVHITGNPIRKSLEIVPKENAVTQWNLNKDKSVILVFGGSQGAQSLNRVIAEIADELLSKYDAQLLWQIGTRNEVEVRNWEISQNPNVRILPYIEEMNFAYSAADIIVSRAGAVTLAELAVAGKPCVLVPYPHAAANHQVHNAQTIVNAGAAFMVKEGEGFKKNLKNYLEILLTDKDSATKMGENWSKIRRPDAASKIADNIIEMVRE